MSSRSAAVSSRPRSSAAAARAPGGTGGGSGSCPAASAGRPATVEARSRKRRRSTGVAAAPRPREPGAWLWLIDAAYGESAPVGPAARTRSFYVRRPSVVPCAGAPCARICRSPEEITMSTRPSRRALSAAPLLSTLMAPAAWAQEDEGLEAFGASMPVAKAAAKTPRETPSRRIAGAMDPRLAPQVALSTVDHEALFREDALRDLGTQAKVLRFSVGRALTLTARDGSWTDLADGSPLWVADVVSPGALGLRLHFSAVSLPKGAELAVWGDGEAASSGFTAREGTAKAAAAEFHFGSAAARPEFWTGTLAGERAHVEYLVPAGAARDEELPFRLDSLQHVY